MSRTLFYNLGLSYTFIDTEKNLDPPREFCVDRGKFKC